MRIGFGFDIHPLVAGRKCILGGIEVPHKKGLQGHSDADALLHAITDAILGASGLGDIGTHFPDTDPKFKGVDSLMLLRLAKEKVAQEGWTVSNVDSTIIAEEPKLQKFIPQMREKIAQLLDLDLMAVNVKATTHEKLGALGRGEGIAAHAVVLLEEV